MFQNRTFFFCFAFLLSCLCFFTQKSFAEEYVIQCDLYKENNYDRTKISNRPLEEYLVGESSSKAVEIMQKYKIDKYCLQRADLEYSLNYIRDTKQREQIHLQITSLKEHENEEREVLRIIEERAERIKKFLEEMRALAQAEIIEIKKNFTDKKAEILSNIETILQSFDKKEEETLERIVEEIKKIQSVESEKREVEIEFKKDALKKVIREQYVLIKQNLENTKQIFQKEIEQTITTLFSQERSRFQNQIEIEITDTAERIKKLEAYDALMNEKKALYQEKIKEVIRTQNQSITLFEKSIESFIGPVIISKNNPIRKSLLVVTNSNDLIEQQNKIILVPVEHKVDTFIRNTDELVVDMVTLMQSADFQLTMLLEENSSRTLKIVSDIENGNFKNLETTLNNLNRNIQSDIYKQVTVLEQEIIKDWQEVETDMSVYHDQNPVSEYAANILESIQEDYEVTMQDERWTKVQEQLLAIEMFEDVYEEQVSEEVKNAVSEITKLYGAYTDYLLDYFMNKTEVNQSTLNNFVERANQGYRILENAFYDYPTLDEAVKNSLRFELLSNLYRFTILVPERDEYKLNTVLLQKIKQYAKDRNKIHALKESFIMDAKSPLENTFTQRVAQFIGGKVFASELPTLNTLDIMRYSIQAQREIYDKYAFSFPQSVSNNTLVSYQMKEIDDMQYYFNSDKNFVVVVKNNDIEKIQYYDPYSLQIRKEILPGGITRFFDYDFYNRLISRTDARTKDLWVEEKQDVVYPLFSQKTDGHYSVLSYTEFDYIGSGNNIRERRYYSPQLTQGKKQATKTLNFRYLYEDMEIMDQRTQRERDSVISRELQVHYEDMQSSINISDSVLSSLMRDTVSQVLFHNALGGHTGTAEFYYDEYFDLEMIRGTDNEFVSLGLTEQGILKKKYPNSIINRELTSTVSKIDGNTLGYYIITPIYFLDNNGVVLQDISKIDELVRLANNFTEQFFKGISVDDICDGLSAKKASKEIMTFCSLVGSLSENEKYIAEKMLQGLFVGMSEAITYMIGDTLSFPLQILNYSWEDSVHNTKKDTQRIVGDINELLKNINGEELLKVAEEHMDTTAFISGRILGNIYAAFVPLPSSVGKIKIAGKVKTLLGVLNSYTTRVIAFSKRIIRAANRIAFVYHDVCSNNAKQFVIYCGKLQSFFEKAEQLDKKIISMTEDELRLWEQEEDDGLTLEEMREVGFLLRRMNQIEEQGIQTTDDLEIRKLTAFSDPYVFELGSEFVDALYDLKQNNELIKAVDLVDNMGLFDFFLYREKEEVLELGDMLQEMNLLKESASKTLEKLSSDDQWNVLMHLLQKGDFSIGPLEIRKYAKESIS